MADLCPGDIILAINGENTDNMTHLEAQNKIKACVDQLLLSVNRLVLSDVLLCFAQRALAGPGADVLSGWVIGAYPWSG